MQRDFTASAQQDLLNMVHQVESEKWSDITDWIGDRFLDLRSLVGELSIGHYLSKVSDYHKLVIDKNNAAEKDINAIFDEVYAVDATYLARFSANMSRLDNYIALLNTVAGSISSAGGIDTSGLDKAFAAYDVQEDVLHTIAVSDDGLTDEVIRDLDPNVVASIVQHLVANIIDHIPDVGVNQEFELPVGVGVTFYYKVEGEIKAGSDAEIKVAIDDGRARLKEFSIPAGSSDALIKGSVDADDGFSVTGSVGNDNGKVEGSLSGDGDIAITSSSGHNEFSLDTKDGSAYHKLTWEYNGATYTYKNGVRLDKAEIYSEESVKVDVKGGSITSQAGLKVDTTSKWRSLPAPVPVSVTEPVSLPSFSLPQWSSAEIATAATVIAVGIVITGLVLAPFTGGGSLVLCAV